MTRLTACTLVLLPLLAACGDKDDDDDDDDATADFAPTGGHWTSTDEAITVDSCGIYDEEDPNDTGRGGFTLVDNGDGTFGVTFDEEDEDGWDVLTCTLTGMDFACDQHTMSQVIEELGDATLVGTQDVTGSFADASTLSGTAQIAIDCEGADCGTAAKYSGMDFPCALTTTFAAEAD